MIRMMDGNVYVTPLISIFSLVSMQAPVDKKPHSKPRLDGVAVVLDISFRITAQSENGERNPTLSGAVEIDCVAVVFRCYWSQITR